MRPLAFITGASAGIGLSTARLLAERGYDLIITAKKADDRLPGVAEEIRAKYSVAVDALSFNIGAGLECAEALKWVKDKLPEVSVLVNNAGIGLGFGSLASAESYEWSRMIDVNIKGLLRMCKAIVPHMVAKNHGHIVNLGSVTGRYALKGEGAYCATKHAVYALTEAMRMDLFGTKIRVTIVEPGLTRSEFSPPRIYEGMTPLNPEDVANAIVWSLERPRHVNIQEIVLTSKDQYSVSMIHRRPPVAEKK